MRDVGGEAPAGGQAGHLEVGDRLAGPGGDDEGGLPDQVEVAGLDDRAVGVVAVRARRPRLFLHDLVAHGQRGVGRVRHHAVRRVGAVAQRAARHVEVADRLKEIRLAAPFIRQVQRGLAVGVAGEAEFDAHGHERIADQVRGEGVVDERSSGGWGGRAGGEGEGEHGERGGDRGGCPSEALAQRGGYRGVQARDDLWPAVERGRRVSRMSHVGNPRGGRVGTVSGADLGRPGWGEWLKAHLPASVSSHQQGSEPC